MTVAVVDASVVVKWLVPERGEETGAEQALRLLRQVQESRVRLLQPAHWLAEVAAVAVRLSPATAEKKVTALHAMRVSVRDTRPVLLRACRLAADLDHHLFDTLYHAVALEAEGVLVTADERYFQKAQSLGQIVRLAEYEAS